MLPISIFQLNLLISNAYLIRGKKSILVDTGGAPVWGLLIQQLQKLGVSLQDLALVVLTHVHFDHAGNLAAIQKHTECPCAVHCLEKTYLENGQNSPIVPIHPFGRALKPFMEMPFTPARAEVIIDDGLDLVPYGVDARIAHTPGHTPGSLSIFTADNQAIVGDLIGGGWPLGQFQPEKPRHHYWATSLPEVKSSLQTVLSLQPSKIYVGHGGPVDGHVAKKFFHPGLQATTGRIQ